MNKEISLDELNLKEYAQQRKIEQLRREMFSQRSEDISKEMNTLLEAEKELIKLEKERNTLITQQSNRGLVLSTKMEDSSNSVDGISRGDSDEEISIKVQVGMEYLPTSIYHLFTANNNPLIICEIKALHRDKQIKVTSYIEGYSAKAVNTIEVEANRMETLYQLPTLFPHLIKDITELTKATLHVKVEEIGGDIVREDSYTISLLSRNSAISNYYNPEKNELIDISFYLGVFVTPNQPEIIRFLRTIANFHQFKSLGGYQGNVEGDEEFKSGKYAVTQQVQAIFHALKATDLIYTNSIIDFNPHRNLYGQRVRLPKEALKEQQANCLDGTFLYASLLEACSLNPAIALIPGHAFVAWESWDGNGEWQFLETTMTSSHRFEEARHAGNATAKAHYEQDTLQIISINDLRAKGIMPME